MFHCIDGEDQECCGFKRREAVSRGEGDSEAVTKSLERREIKSCYLPLALLHQFTPARVIWPWVPACGCLELASGSASLLCCLGFSAPCQGCARFDPSVGSGPKSRRDSTGEGQQTEGKGSGSTRETIGRARGGVVRLSTFKRATWVDPSTSMSLHSTRA